MFDKENNTAERKLSEIPFYMSMLSPSTVREMESQHKSVVKRADVRYFFCVFCCRCFREFGSFVSLFPTLKLDDDAGPLSVFFLPSFNAVFSLSWLVCVANFAHTQNVMRWVLRRVSIRFSIPNGSRRSFIVNFWFLCALEFADSDRREKYNVIEKKTVEKSTDEFHKLGL